MYEQDIDVPPVVHGPVLISFGDLNGFEFGTKVRNPYQRLFEREPDAVIADSVAVFYGDFSLPEAASLRYILQAQNSLGKHPDAALAAARKAVALVPNGFDANLELGDALVATGDKAGAAKAYRVALGRVPEMEPTSQKESRPEVEKKLASVLDK
jgi:tetratricopeptide (TPR) repeat protein